MQRNDPVGSRPGPVDLGEPTGPTGGGRSERRLREESSHVHTDPADDRLDRPDERRPEPRRADVAAAIGSTRQNVTQLVTALERKGMLRVDDHPTDNRRRVLTTTRLSDDYWERRNAGDYDALAEWFGMLDGTELHGLCDALGRVVAGRQSASR